MMNWFRKLIGLNGREDIESLKEGIRVERELALEDIQKLNKRLKVTIEAGTIELVIKNIKESTEGK